MGFVVLRGVLSDKKKPATFVRYAFQIGHTQGSRNGTLRRILSSGGKLSERFGGVCHRTLLNIAFLSFEVERLNTIRRILTDRLNRAQPVFEEKDEKAFRRADTYWEQPVKGGKIDASDRAYEEKERMANIDEPLLKDGREVGAEWVCYRAMGQLRFREKPEELGWEEEQIRLAITQIIGRAVYPPLRTSHHAVDTGELCRLRGHRLSGRIDYERQTLQECIGLIPDKGSVGRALIPKDE